MQLWDAFLEDYERDTWDWTLRFTLEAFWYYCQDGSGAVDRFIKLRNYETVQPDSAEEAQPQIKPKEKIMDIDLICFNRACLFFDGEHLGNCRPCNSCGDEPLIYVGCDEMILNENKRRYFYDTETKTIIDTKEKIKKENKMQYFRLRTSEVKAVQLNHANWDEIRELIGDSHFKLVNGYHDKCGEEGPWIETKIFNRHIEAIEGPSSHFVAKHGDWIIKEPGGLYVISSKVFERIYERVVNFTDGLQTVSDEVTS